MCTSTRYNIEMEQGLSVLSYKENKMEIRSPRAEWFFKLLQLISFGSGFWFQNKNVTPKNYFQIYHLGVPLKDVKSVRN